MSFRRLNYREPSVIRGIITAVIALAASLGFVTSDDIKGAAEGLIPVVAFLVPLVQSLWTRQAVVSPETADARVAAAAGRHAAPEL